MLRVTVELVPFGVEDNKRIIASALIWNKDGDGHKCDYGANVQENGWKYAPARDVQVEILDYDRRASVWDLIKAVLEEMENNNNNERTETAGSSIKIT